MGISSICMMNVLSSMLNVRLKLIEWMIVDFEKMNLLNIDIMMRVVVIMIECLVWKFCVMVLCVEVLCMYVFCMLEVRNS